MLSDSLVRGVYMEYNYIYLWNKLLKHFDIDNQDGYKSSSKINIMIILVNHSITCNLYM